MDGDGSSTSRESGADVIGEDPLPPNERLRAREANGFSPGDEEAEDGPQSGLLQRIFALLSRSNGDEEEAGTANGLSHTGRPRDRREMIERVMAFGEKRVYDVMAPRADIVAVDADTSLEELIKAFAEAGHSRMPIYRGDLDDPIGMVHIKDVVGLLADPETASAPQGRYLKKIRRPVLYVPQSMRITDLLLKMQASRIHMALVIDEYGGTDGLLTIEDLVEEIVGDINDEHDEDDAPTLTPRQGGGWDADARVELDEFEAATGVRIEVEDEEIVTLGGVVFSLAGRVPQRGEVIAHEQTGLDFEVTEADARKVRRLRIRRRRTPDASGADI